MRALLASAFCAAALLSAHAEPVTVETATGTVEIIETPQKVVVYDIAALDTLTALGVKAAGTPANVYVDYLGKAAAEAEPAGTLFEPDFEAVYALQPDLVITGSRSAKQTEPLGELAPTIDMTIYGDDVIEQARARLATYGKMFDRKEQADELEAELRTELEKVRTAAAPVGKALIVMTNGPKISVYGPGSRFGWLHHDLGIAPASEEIDVSSHGEAVSFEYIRDLDPDWLLVVDRAAAIGNTADSARTTLDNELVAQTTAWKKGQVVYLDAAKVYIASGGYTALMDTMAQLADAFSGEAKSQ
ncbi:siderophore ABC transporter substrate-binding protein [Rhodobacterales bacterium]|nr:siderophore ABC transporter substrate-binding protein [Rhodobacterales bacterium]